MHSILRAVIVSVAMAVGLAVQGQEPAGQRTIVQISSFAGELLGRPKALRVSGYYRDGLVEWNVVFDPTNIESDMDRMGIAANADTKARLIEWFRAVNAKLL